MSAASMVWCWCVCVCVCVRARVNDGPNMETFISASSYYRKVVLHNAEYVLDHFSKKIFSKSVAYFQANF